jgi:hypothetical protein
MIYAIEARGTNRIKFGKVKNPEKRLKELSTGSPYHLHLLAAVEWNDEIERLIHAAFKGRRVAGEWFERDEYIDMFVTYMMENPYGEPNYAKESRYGICMQILVEMLARWPCRDYGAEPIRILEFDEWYERYREQMRRKRHG